MILNIGENAGRVWHALQGNGSMDVSSIANGTGLSGSDVEKAIGWLGKEGTLSIIENKYSLVEGGHPSITHKYGNAAGSVWEVLFGNNPSSALRDCLGLEKKVMNAALGWLAKEGKVDEIDIFIMESLHSDVPDEPEKIIMTGIKVPRPPKVTKKALETVMDIINSVPYYDEKMPPHGVPLPPKKKKVKKLTVKKPVKAKKKTLKKVTKKRVVLRKKKK